MEARELLSLDERRYRSLREHAEAQDELLETSELRSERILFEQVPHNLMQVYHLRGTRVWGAFDALSLAGVVAMSAILKKTNIRYLWLWGMYVQPRYRGTPASGLLMESALQWAERHYPGSTVRGSFHRNNRRAWQMVNRFGFVAVADGQEFIRLRLAPEDHVVVECTTRSIFGVRKSA